MIAIVILVTLTTMVGVLVAADIPKSFTRGWWRGIGATSAAVFYFLPVIGYVAFCVWARW